MSKKNRGTLEPTGLFRVVEKRFSPPEVEICTGTEKECREIFESHGDRIEQMYRETDPNALTAECWIDEVQDESADAASDARK